MDGINTEAVRVTSLAEVWIETEESGQNEGRSQVTSLAEVWIETNIRSQ